jgi:hypothetical protein
MSTATDDFEEIVHYDIYEFFEDYVTFANSYYQYIVNYYNGLDINKDAFNYLDDLLDEADTIEGLIEHYKNRLNRTDFWDIVEKFSEIQTKLSTTENLSRWLRSSRSDRYSSNIKIEYTQRERETIERISKNSGISDYDNKWADIAINNDLEEEDYTSSGGAILSISLPNNKNFNIKNVVDELNSTNVYGKDIVKKLEFIDGDLSVLTGIDALLQTFETIFETFKGSIPEFPEDGVESSAIGSNTNVISYPSIFRNLLQLFQKDDRFASITLDDLYKKDDGIYLKISATTKIGDTLINDVAV